MQSSHAATAVDVVFDEPNLIADAGLVPVLGLAERVGLVGLVDRAVTITGAANSGGANPGAKVMSVLAGMLAGADSIDDLDRLRHTGMGRVFDGIRAPSTADPVSADKYVRAGRDAVATSAPAMLSAHTRTVVIPAG